MKITVDLACEDDLLTLWDMYTLVCDDMTNTFFDVDWKMGEHPSMVELESALQDQGLLIAQTVDAVVGALIFNTTSSPDYKTIPWRVDCAPEEVGILHLIAVSPIARGLGVGDALLQAAARLARERGFKALRLDVFDINTPAIRLYERNGFMDCGVFEIEVARNMIHASHMMELAL